MSGMQGNRKESMIGMYKYTGASTTGKYLIYQG